MLRNNMWVMTTEGIGILFQYNNSVSTVHLVDPKTGSTKLEMGFDTKKLRQATYLEIPECRRGMPKLWFNKKGYV